jgi:hypothetical protein
LTGGTIDLNVRRVLRDVGDVPDVEILDRRDAERGDRDRGVLQRLRPLPGQDDDLFDAPLGLRLDRRRSVFAILSGSEGRCSQRETRCGDQASIASLHRA